MRLICYSTSAEPPRLIAAPVTRDWMDHTTSGFAYRCLPLNIANAHGWMLLNAVPFVAHWNGGEGIDAVTVQPTTGETPMLACSHFGYGVLTFQIHALFRTEPGYDLMATGPFNQPKDAIQPLTGIVETDWAPFTFTMNWKFTRKHTPVAFARDEPICMIFPLPRGLVEAVEPEIRPIESEPEVNEAYREWSQSRQAFNEGLKVPGSEAQAQRWQKDYFQGTKRFATPPEDHRTKLRPRDFVARR